MKSNILIIDDSKLICDAFSSIVAREGHLAFSALTLQGGLEILRSGKLFDLVFLDVRLPDTNGLEHIREIVNDPSMPEVIIITAFGSPEGADMAMKSGALDYIEKPSSTQVITLRLIRALEHHREKIFRLKMREFFGKSEG